MPLRLIFGEFELDEARFELRQRGQPVAMQPKVLDLVLYLAKHRDRVVTKDELLDAVWRGTAVTEASLSQAVSLARRALDDTPEEQHTLRTVRSKGLQFVAGARVMPSDRPAAAPGAALVARPPQPLVATMSETAEDRTAGAPITRSGPCLVAALHCETPSLGGAGWSLDDIDEVEIGRGSERRAVRRVGPTRVLAISIPGRLFSRKHARITRTPHGWLLIDEGSRNGTYVGGDRIDKHMLAEGDIIDCGRTLFLLGTEAHRGEIRGHDFTGEGSILGSVTPRVLDLERDLERIAVSDVPVLLLGESGTGKTHVAEAIHRLSERVHLVRFDVDSPSSPGAADGESDGASVTLLVENLDRAGAAALTHLERELEARRGARVIATSLSTAAALAERLPAALQTRLTGFTCELPALRHRVGDIGVLAARLLGETRASEIDIDAGRALLRHPWPGNVRELAHRLKIAASLSAGQPMRLNQLLPESV